MLAYSARKYRAQRKPLYSVWKPATSSDSASGRSKGARLVSAMAEVKKKIKPIICGQKRPWCVQEKTFQPRIPTPHFALACCSIMDFRLKELAISSKPTTDIVRASS